MISTRQKIFIFTLISSTVFYFPCTIASKFLCCGDSSSVGVGDSGANELGEVVVHTSHETVIQGMQKMVQAKRTEATLYNLATVFHVASSLIVGGAIVVDSIVEGDTPPEYIAVVPVILASLGILTKCLGRSATKTASSLEELLGG